MSDEEPSAGSPKLYERFRVTATLALGTTTDPTGRSIKAPHEPSLELEQSSSSTAWLAKGYCTCTHRTTTMSPSIHSRTSRTNISILGAPIPIDTMDTGTLEKRPVMVRKPRSESSLNGGVGDASRRVARCCAREGEPTVSYSRAEARVSLWCDYLERETHDAVGDLAWTQTEVVHTPRDRSWEICPFKTSS
jgi:hypothetical protein